VTESVATVAIVPAAGTGERLGAGIPKAFVDLGGRSVIERTVDGLISSGVIDHVLVAVPALRVVDTIKAVDANGVVLGTPERAGLRAAQTPQGFETALLRRAYERAGAAAVTDDASLVESIGTLVHTVAGDPLAFKITTALDLQLARSVLDP